MDTNFLQFEIFLYLAKINNNFFHLQPFCGQETIGWYSLDIFQRAQVNVNNYLLSILLQASTLIGYMIAACLIPRVKRRKQFLLSCAFMGVSQVLLGFSLQFTVSNNLLIKCNKI